MANKINITVGGISYSISGDESVEYLNQLGDELENKMRLLTRKKPYLSTTTVAIITALESCDEAKKAKLENERLKKDIERLEKALEEKRGRCSKTPNYQERIKF